MSETQRCEKCGGELPGDGFTTGACPHCVLKLAIDVEPDESADAPETPLERLGDFELLREIGRGGMGVVYEARQLSLKRRVALKVLPPGLGLSAAAIERFKREAQAAARLHHTNIVPVYAIGEEDGCHYYAMELIRGRSLAQVVGRLRGDEAKPGEVDLTLSRGDDQPLASAPTAEDLLDSRVSSGTDLSNSGTGDRSWFRAVATQLADVADALDYAHEHGIVHRDVKPANLMLSAEGRLCVTDFGLAMVSHEPGLTITGSLMGSPSYMSPEQIAAGRIKLDRRTDVYSLGTVLYELLTLQPPFAGETREQIMTAIVTKEPREPRSIEPRVPFDLETICLKALEKDPDRRYPSASVMADDLRRFLQDELIAARRPGPVERTAKWIRRHPLLSVSLAATVVTLLLAAIVVNLSLSQRDAEVERALADARYSLAQGDYGRAAESIELAASRRADNPEVRLIRARALLRLRRRDEVVENAQKFLQANPDDWTSHLILASAAPIAQTDLRTWTPEHQAHLEAVARHAPETPDVFYLRALAADRPREALELLERALAADPAHADALLEHGRRMLAVRNFGAALRDSDRLVAVRPRSAEGWRLQARAYFDLHALDAAKTAIDRAMALEPEQPTHDLLLAEFYARAGRRDEAIDAASRAIELDPTFHEAWELRGELTLEPESSLRDLRRAVELEPAERWSTSALAEALRRGGNEDELRDRLRDARAIAERDRSERAYSLAMDYETNLLLLLGGPIDDEDSLLEFAMGLDPEGPLSTLIWVAHAQTARLHRSRGEREAELDHCRRAAAVIERDLESIWQRGGRLYPCGDPDLLLDELELLLEAAPDWADPYVDRAELHAYFGRFEQAFADVDRAAELAPSWDSPHGMGSRIALDAGLPLRALEYLEAYDATGHAGHDVVRVRAQAHLAVGEADSALAAIDRLIEFNPGLGHQFEAEALMELQRPEHALRAASAMIREWPESAHSFWIRAKVHVESGECDAAARDLVTALTGERGSAPRVQSTVSLVHSVGLHDRCPSHYDPQLALDLARKAASVPRRARLGRSSAWFWERSGAADRALGFALYRTGDYREAAEALQHALDRERPDDPHTWLFLAMARHALGFPDEARVAFDRAHEAAGATRPASFDRLRAEAATRLGL